MYIFFNCSKGFVLVLNNPDDFFLKEPFSITALILNSVKVHQNRSACLPNKIFVT